MLETVGGSSGLQANEIVRPYQSGPSGPEKAPHLNASTDSAEAIPPSANTIPKYQ
jgi:hypothetical protein